MANRDIKYDLAYADSLSLDGKPLACLKLNDGIVWEKAKDYTYIPPKSYIDTGIILTNYTTHQEERTREVETPYSYTCNFDCASGTGVGGFFSSTKTMQHIGGGPYGSYSEYPIWTYNFTVPSNAYSVSVKVTFTRRTVRNEPAWVSSRTGDLLFNGTTYSASPQTKTSTGAYTVSTTQGGGAACYGTISVSYKIKTQEKYYVTVKDYTNYRVELDFELEQSKVRNDEDGKHYAWVMGGRNGSTNTQQGILCDYRNENAGYYIRNFNVAPGIATYYTADSRLCLVYDNNNFYFKDNPDTKYPCVANDIPNNEFSIYLNASNDSGTASLSDYGMKVYGFRIYYNDELQYNFIPDRNGMRDIKNNVFHPIINTNYSDLYVYPAKIGKYKILPNEIYQTSDEKYAFTKDSSSNKAYLLQMDTLEQENTFKMNSYMIIPKDVKSIEIRGIAFVVTTPFGGGTLIIYHNNKTYEVKGTAVTLNVSEGDIIRFYGGGSCAPGQSGKMTAVFRITLLE